jgi:chromosome segregation ATPase
VNELRDEVARAVARAAKDVDAVEAETKRVVFAAASETAVSKTALADLRSFYETELLKVKEHAKRAQNASEKRIEAVLDENATLRSMLASKMTLEAAEEMKTELAGRLDECAAAAASSSAETRRHETRWSKDVARIKESVLEAKKSMTATSHELERRIQEYERLDGERVERVEKELREHVVECVGDLDDLADRQKALERRWRAANEKLREASDQVDRSEPDQNLAAIEKAQSRWAATRAADGARYRETSDFSTSETDGPLEKENRGDRGDADRVSDPAGNTDETRVVKTKNKTHARDATKTRVSGPAAAERQRGVHAAELLFGRGSRADPNVRARKL